MVAQKAIGGSNKPSWSTDKQAHRWWTEKQKKNKRKTQIPKQASDAHIRIKKENKNYKAFQSMLARTALISSTTTPSRKVVSTSILLRSHNSHNND